MASSRKSAKHAETALTPARDVLASLPAGTRVAVAFSGGLDSSVLLQLCLEVLGAERVHALHVAHGLQEAARDWPAHCARVAAVAGVPCDILPLAGRPAAGDSLEAWARTHRYAALAQAARAAGTAVLLTAHHADDQAETVLMRIARGTGLQGLTAIAPALQMGELRVLRPLLSCSRADLLAWAQARGLDWVEDPSNLDTRRQRNRIRHEVLPVLEAALPGFGAQLEQLARQAHETREAVEALAHRDLETVRQAGSAALDRRALQALGAVRAGGVLRAWIEEAGLRPPTRARLQEMWRQLVESEATYGLVVHDGRRLRRHRDLVLWEAETAPEVAAPWPFRWQGEAFLPVPGRSGGLRFERVAAPEAPAGAPGVEWLRTQSLVVRPPRARDRLRPHAGGPQRSLRNLFQEQGVPAWARPACHVLECAGRVLLVAGLGADQSPDWPGEGDRVRVSWVSDPRQPPV